MEKKPSVIIGETPSPGRLAKTVIEGFQSKIEATSGEIIDRQVGVVYEQTPIGLAQQPGDNAAGDDARLKVERALTHNDSALGVLIRRMRKSKKAA